MNAKVEEIVKERATYFVDTLNSRYKAHVSDDFIIAYIVHHFNRYWIPGRNQHIPDLAYKSCVTLFESLLEYGCKAGGNGHHVAQNFSSIFPNVTYDELKDNGTI